MGELISLLLLYVKLLTTSSVPDMEIAFVTGSCWQILSRTYLNIYATSNIENFKSLEWIFAIPSFTLPKSALIEVEA